MWILKDEAGPSPSPISLAPLFGMYNNSSTEQYIVVQYSTVTVQYSTVTVQYSTVQYSNSTVQFTVQYSTVQ